jgi:uncharacterized protein (TIGR03437 family)
VTKRRGNGWFAISLAIGFWAVPPPAQSQSISTCSIAPPTAQSFSIERTVAPSDNGTTYSTDLSASILASLADGSMEMREQLLYNPQANTLTSTVFLVDAGAPIPTPSSVNIASTTLASYVISINGVYSSCSPVPSFMFAGTVTSSSGGAAAANGIYNLTFSGTPAVVSIGYTNTNPPAVNNVVTLLAGVAVSYSAAGFGTLTFPSNATAGQPTITSVVNSASMLPTIAADSFVTIMGSSLAPKTDTWNNSIVNGALPTTLDGVSVTIGGQPAYISYISPGQINAIAPQVSPGPVTVTVTNGSLTSVAYSVTSSQYAPALFVWPGNQAVATHQDGTYAAKAGTFPGVTTTPATPGETIILWGSGFGPTTPATPLGTVVPTTPTYNTTTLPSATLNNGEVTVLGAALSPNSAGLYQVAIQVPSPLANGDYYLQVSIGGMTSPLGTILTVQQ